MRALRGMASFALVVLSACAHANAPQCPTCPVAIPCPTPPAWVDRKSIADSSPLSLYDISWVLMTGDSGALTTAPPDLHTFTLGSWECALSDEQTDDALQDGLLRVDRKRRLVCTHGSGLTMQTELSCSYLAPSPITQGVPTATTARSTRIALGDAPSLTLSCEPQRVDRLPVLGPGRVTSGEACIENASVIPCPTKM